MNITSTLLAVAALAGSMGTNTATPHTTYTLRPPGWMGTAGMRLLKKRKGLNNTPPKNQRQRRKRARQAFAAGDRAAFNR